MRSVSRNCRCCLLSTLPSRPRRSPRPSACLRCPPTCRYYPDLSADSSLLLTSDPQMPWYDSPYPYESYGARGRAQEILRHMRRHYARSRSGPPAVHPHVVLGSDLHCVTRRSAVRAMCRNTNPDFREIILRCERISDPLYLFFPSGLHR